MIKATFGSGSATAEVANAGRHEKHDVRDERLDPTRHGVAVCAIES